MKEIFYSLLLRWKMRVYPKKDQDIQDNKKASYARIERSFCRIIAKYKAKRKKDRGTVWEEWQSLLTYISTDTFHDEEKYLLDKLIWNYDQQGEKQFIAWYKNSQATLRRKYDKDRLSLDDADLSHKINNH